MHFGVLWRNKINQLECRKWFNAAWCAGRKVLIWAWIIWLLWTFFVSGVGPRKISELLMCSRKKRTQREDFGFAHQVLTNTTSDLGYPVLHAFCSCLAKCSKENK